MLKSFTTQYDLFLQVDSENTSRFGSRVAKEMQKAMQALHMLLPGTAVVYYGDEIAMEDGEITTAVDPLAQLSGVNNSFWL